METVSPDEQTLQAWEDMRNEIWHELQEGASADIPDATIDDLGDLIVTLEALKPKTHSLNQLPLSA